MRLVKLFSNRSLITQMTILLVLLFVSWTYGGWVFIKQLIESQLINQAQVMVNNAEALNDHVSAHSRVWIRDKSDYPGNWIDKVPTEDGTVFYSKNPVMFLAEYAEGLSKKGFASRFKVTAEQPMNPKNSPDDYEKEILQEIAKNLSKEPQHSHIGTSFRYIKPLYYVESCLACHGDVSKAPQSIRTLYGEKRGYGFKAGDLAGALSVTLDVNIWKLLSDIFNITLFLFFVVPPVLVYCFVIFLTRYISDLSMKLSTYSRGDPVNIDSKLADPESENELHLLWRDVGSVMERMHGTFIQLSIMSKKIKSNEGLAAAGSPEQNGN